MNFNKEALPANIGSKSRTPNLCGTKRKWAKNHFKDIFRGYDGQDRNTKAVSSRKRSKKFNLKGLNSKSKPNAFEPNPHFERSNAKNFPEVWFDSDYESGNDFKLPTVRKRAKSMAKPMFSLCPPPPLNTTQYLSHMCCERPLLEFNLPLLPDLDEQIDEELDDMKFDENTPDTWASMEGKPIKKLPTFTKQQPFVLKYKI